MCNECKKSSRIKDLYSQIVAIDMLSKMAGEKEDLEALEKELASGVVAPTKKEPKKEESPEDLANLEKELLKGVAPATPATPAPKEAPITMPGRVIEEERLPLMPFEKRVSPGAILAKRCPLCGADNRPIFLQNCKNCQKLYNKIVKREKHFGQSPERAIEDLANLTRYGRDVLQTVYKNQGITPITNKDVIEVPTSIKKQLEDFMNYRLNIEKNPTTKEPIYSESGLPIPLAKQKYFTTKQLADVLRLSPDEFQKRIDDYNTRWVDENKPTDKRLQLGKIRPVYMAGMGMKERRIEKTDPETGKTEHIEVPKSANMAVWNWDTIKEVFTDWIKELTERIIPEEKVQKAKNSIERLQEAVQKAIESQDLVEAQMKESNERVKNRAHMKVLSAMRKADPVLLEKLEKKYKVKKDRIEERYGADLNYYLDIIKQYNEMFNRLNDRQHYLEKAIEYKKQYLIKLLEEKGYKFDVEEELKAKESEEGQDELEKELLSTSRVKRLNTLLRFAKEPEQTSFWEKLGPKKVDVPIERETGNIGLLRRSPEKELFPETEMEEEVGPFKFDTEREKVEKEIKELKRKMGLITPPSTVEERKQLGEYTIELKDLQERLRSIAPPKKKPVFEETREKILRRKPVGEVALPEGEEGEIMGQMKELRKKISNIMKKKVSGIATKEELNELDATEKKLQELEETLYPPFVPATPEFAEPTEKEKAKFTRTCPYPGCGAKISENATICWNCKSPVKTGEIRKVVKRTIRQEKEVKVKNPATGLMETELKEYYIPIHSLITITTDKDGKPVSAKCEKISITYKDTGRTKKAPVFKDTMASIKRKIRDMLKSDKYTDEQKKNIAGKDVNKIYENFVKKDSPDAEPWKNVPDLTPQAGLPIEPCKNCPIKVSAPFKDTCKEIEAVINSLEGLPTSGWTVWDYTDIRKIKEEKGIPDQPTVSDYIPE